MTEQEHPIVPYRTFVVVWVLLLLLTAVTVAVSRVHLGPLNIWAALGIASVKSALVIFFFMHLKYEKLQAFRIFLLVALLILAIFIGFTFFDVLYR
ncbi:MAG TPA: cytochrome C oxidase subunit IV family protein [Desulfuromonadales bacterium]|jgi:cytochrome c oxidase subunit 4|nr:cytochrome C oxidase subunit IV family protein [Desulfuromonadales bacterium]